MLNQNQIIASLLEDISRQKESLVLDQLNDLISRGLLVIEQNSPVLVKEYDSDKITLKQQIQLTLKDKEYIEKLEKENSELKTRLEHVKNLVRALKINFGE